MKFFKQSLLLWLVSTGLLLSEMAFARDQKVPTAIEKPKDMQDPPNKAIDAIKDAKDGNKEDDSRIRHYLTLTVGLEHEEREIKLPEGYKVLGDFEKIAAQAYDTNTGILRITPQTVGVGTLTLHDKEGKLLFEFRLDIRKSSLDKVAREIKSLIGDIEGVQIKIINNKVVVDGQILLPRDMSRIGNVVMQFGDQAVSLVALSPLAQKKIAEIIEREINNPEVSVRAVNDKFILEGVVDNDDERERAKKIAFTYLPETLIDPAETQFIKKRKSEPVIDMLQVRPPAPRGPEKLIQLVIHYVELNKDYNKMFRFQWMPDLKDGSSVAFGGESTRSPAGGVFSQITGIISNLFPKLNWLKGHNFARILESSTLIVENNQKGEMKSVSNVPYPVVNANGQSGTQFQPVGINTAITPAIISANSDSIRLDLGFAISQLIGITDSGPMTTENNMHTIITVRSGQSAAVGGLIRNSNYTDYNRLPPDVSRNPIISLYASKGFQRKQTQFVVFVTPIIKSSASSGVEKIKRKFHLRE
jgi:pilus assembly protein CpaC